MLQGNLKRNILDFVFVVLAAGTVFFANLGGPRLWDRDEPRNAGCAAEMLAADDWVTPVFNGELRPHKPALTYWFMMLSYGVLGVTEFAARLPSALFGIGTVLLTYLMGHRLFGRSTGLWAALVLATTVMFSIASRAATPDAPLIFFSTLATAIFVLATTHGNAALDRSTSFVIQYPRRWSIVALMYAVMGCAVLAKGPIGLVLPTAVIGMHLLIMRLPTRRTTASPSLAARLSSLLRPFAPGHFLRTCWVMRPLTAVILTLAVALPWYVWVHLRTDGAWTYGFFVTHNVGRAMNAMDGHHGGVWYYPVALLIGSFPWSVCWLPAILDGAAQIRDKKPFRDGYLFVFCWVGVYIALFSIARTKLPSYITPCYPGLALLLGCYVDRFARGDVQLAIGWHRAAFGSLAVIGAAIAVGLPIAAHLLLPGNEVIGILGLIPLIGGVLATRFAVQRRFQLSGRVVGATSFAFILCLMAFVAGRIDRERSLGELYAAVYQNSSVEDVRVASLGSVEPTCVFYCRQPIPSYMTPEEAAAFLRSDSDRVGNHRAIITSEKKSSALLDQLRHERIDVTEIPILLEKKGLVVVRTTAGSTQTALQSDQHVRR